MTTPIVNQRMRLSIMDCLEHLADVGVSDEQLGLSLECLFEDLCASEVSKDQVGLALNRYLTHQAERSAAAALLPITLSLYMAWDWADQSSFPRRQTEFVEAQKLARVLLGLMLGNPGEQVQALQVRWEEKK